MTRLDNAAPVEGASVSIVTLDNKVALDRHHQRRRRGHRAGAATARRRSAGSTSKFDFLVTAEKDGDIAYVGSRLDRRARRPGSSASAYDLPEQNPLLRGTVFTDRGVYRLGEEVHFKAILRHDTPTGIRCRTPARRSTSRVRDSQDRESITRR